MTHTTLEEFISRHPDATINNSEFNPLALTSDLAKAWAASHDFLGVTFVQAGDFIETFAGDARRVAEVADLHCFLKDGLLCVGYPAHASARLARQLADNGIVARKI